MLFDIIFPRGCPGALATMGLRGAGAPPAPHVTELGVGPVSPEVLGLLADMRVRGNEVPPHLGGDGPTRATSESNSDEAFL